jgi:alpha-tubulin suppressor-like RCC1 family protein
LLLGAVAAIGRAEIQVQAPPGPHHLVLGTGTYADGAPVRLQAAPEVGWRFVRWEGNVPAGRETENPFTFTPGGDVTLTAVVEAASDDPWTGWARTRVLAWGSTTSGQLDVPAGLDHVRQIAAGGDFSLALHMDGTVTGWGPKVPLLARIFQLGGRVRAVSASYTRGFVLMEDGRAVEITRTANLGAPTLPGGLNRVRAIYSGYLADATFFDQDPSVMSLPTLTAHLQIPRDMRSPIPTSATAVVSMGIGQWHAYALNISGVLAGWGYNSAGELSTPADLPPVRGLAAGRNYTVALLQDGTVRAWGSVPTSWNLAALTDVVQVAMGSGGLMALRRDGVVLDSGGEPYAGRERVVQVSGAFRHNLALQVEALGVYQRQPAGVVVRRNNPLRLEAGIWGATGVQWFKNGQPLAGQTNLVLEIARTELDDSGLYQIAAWDDTTAVSESVAVCVLQVGHLSGHFTWVTARWREDTGDLEVAVSPEQGNRLIEWSLDPARPVAVVPRSQALTGLSVTAVFERVAPIQVTATVQGRGFVAGVGPQDPGRELELTAAPEVGWRFVRWEGDVPAGRETENPLRLVPESNLNLTAQFEPAENPRLGWFEGRAFVWQREWQIQEVPTGPFAGISSTDGKAIFLRTDGTVATSTARFSYTNATAIPGLSNVVAVSLNPSLWTALLADGRTLGFTFEDRPLTNFLELTDAVELAAGTFSALALREDGTVVPWRSAPGSPTWSVEPPEPLENVAHVAAGWGPLLAVRADGRAVQWGLLRAGGPTPAPEGLSNVVEVSAMDRHTLARLANGSVRAWGGTNSGANIVLGSFKDAAAVVTGVDCSAIVTRQGTLLVWGNQEFSGGQPPVGLSNVVAAALGPYYGLALVGEEVGLAGRVWERQRLRPGQWLHLEPRFLGARHFAWYKDGQSLPGETQPFLRRGPVSAADAGVYHVVAFGRQRALSARLVVEVAPAEQPVALRANLDRGAGQIELILDAPLTGPARIESSTDLVNWEPGETLAGGSASLRLPWSAEPAARYFRLRPAP